MKKYFRFRISILAGLAIALVCSVPTLAAGTDACTAHAERVVANYQHLPATHAALATVPTDDARILFGEMSPKARVQVWTDRIDAYVAEHPGLSDAQVSLLRDAQVVLANNPYALNNDTALWNDSHGVALEALGHRARTLFSRDQVKTIFTRLGTDAGGSALAPMDGATLFKNVPADDAALPQCTCSRESDWCDDGYNCERSSCAEVADECGTFWTYNCDGQCYELDADVEEPTPVEP